MGLTLSRNEKIGLCLLLILPPVSTVVITCFQEITLYQIVVLNITSYQAIITAYLSYNIFRLNQVNSRLPNLTYSLVDVEEIPTSYENHIAVRCKAKIKNNSSGRAKILGFDFDASIPLPPEQRDIPASDAVEIYIPGRTETRGVLDEGEELVFVYDIRGLGYFEKIILTVDETTLGKQRFDINMGDISYLLSVERESE